MKGLSAHHPPNCMLEGSGLVMSAVSGLGFRLTHNPSWLSARRIPPMGMMILNLNLTTYDPSNRQGLPAYCVAAALPSGELMGLFLQSHAQDVLLVELGKLILFPEQYHSQSGNVMFKYI